MKVHNPQPLTPLKPTLVKLINQPFGPRVLRQQRGLVRRRMHRGRHWLSFRVCGTSRRRIWL
ncbi:hypothetical protein DY000_02006884 [Brassica cretica]|uniref:Uncharacterized protein n=1 Tax=Brassica cretica TaxID=69181 RepID=A0ABQ7BVK1_BRACR|nr:hypothetical protein DY000_02006884 [Brassica cretica]